MRAMLHPFCKDLWSPAATNFSVAPSSWHSIRNFLDDSLRFVQAPPHTAIPVGAKLLSARHVPLLCRADLSKVAVTHRRLWLRIECLSSSRRKLSSASTRALQAFERWLQYVPPLASMRPSPHAFADASAKGRHCCLGGFVSCPSLGQVWFSESFSVSDFEEVGIPFGSDLAKEIASCEALAQAGLILGLSALAPCCKFPFASPHSATTLGPNRVSIRCSPQRRPASGSEELIWLAVSAVALVPEFAGSASEIAELIWLWSTGVRLAVQLPGAARVLQRGHPTIAGSTWSARSARCVSAPSWRVGSWAPGRRRFGFGVGVAGSRNLPFSPPLPSNPPRRRGAQAVQTAGVRARDQGGGVLPRCNVQGLLVLGALEPVWLAVKACVRFVVRLAMLEPFAAMSPSAAAKSAEPSRTDALHLNRFDV